MTCARVSDSDRTSCEFPCIICQTLETNNHFARTGRQHCLPKRNPIYLDMYHSLHKPEQRWCLREISLLSNALQPSFRHYCRRAMFGTHETQTNNTRQLPSKTDQHTQSLLRKTKKGFCGKVMAEPRIID
jgi:hypothetical protein